MRFFFFLWTKLVLKKKLKGILIWLKVRIRSKGIPLSQSNKDPFDGMKILFYRTFIQPKSFILQRVYPHLIEGSSIISVEYDFLILQRLLFYIPLKIPSFDRTFIRTKVLLFCFNRIRVDFSIVRRFPLMAKTFFGRRFLFFMGGIFIWLKNQFHSKSLPLRSMK